MLLAWNGPKWQCSVPCPSYFLIPNIYISYGPLKIETSKVEEVIELPFKRVLIFDEDTTNRNLLKKFLTEYKDLSISEANNLNSMSKTFSESSFDLIFLDLKNTKYNENVKKQLGINFPGLRNVQGSCMSILHMVFNSYLPYGEKYTFPYILFIPPHLVRG